MRDILIAAADSVGATATACAMPPRAYLSERFHEFERQTVFNREWLLLCHESEVPTPGSRLAVTVCDEPLLVTRDEAGRIHVLSAVCQHRNYVFAEDTGTSDKVLRCPYHAWTYGLDGCLVGAPLLSRERDLDAMRAQIRLPSLRVEVWQGFVFANFDPDAEPLAPRLAAAEAATAPYRLSDLVVARSVDYPDLPYNWKLLQENALEEYHTSYIHKGFHESMPADLVERAPFEPGEAAVWRRVGVVDDGKAHTRPPWPIPDTIPASAVAYVVFLAIPPMMFASVKATGVKLFRLIPQGPDRTSLRISFLYPRSTLALPDFDRLMDWQLEFVEHIDVPDMTTNTRVQAGLRSRFAARGPYVCQEGTIPQFNRWLLEACLRDARVPAAL